MHARSSEFLILLTVFDLGQGAITFRAHVLILHQISIENTASYIHDWYAAGPS